jgi:hypothetical protein
VKKPPIHRLKCTEVWKRRFKANKKDGRQKKAEELEQGLTFLILCYKRCLLYFHPGAVEQARGFQKDFRTRVERTEKTRLRGKKRETYFNSTGLESA